MNILSIDLGKFNSIVCFFDSHSNHTRFQRSKTEREYLRTVLQSERVELVVMEACSCSGWVSDLCGELGFKTLVCSTHEAESPPQAESLAVENSDFTYCWT